MAQPLFSIVTPMHNDSLYIEAALKSVLSQTFKDWELIVVDDCSTDGRKCISIVERYAREDSRIHLYILTSNRGSSGARNAGLKYVKGRFIAFLDSDDVWHPDYLETMYSHINEQKDKRVAVYFSGYRRMDASCTKSILPDYSCPGTKSYKQLLYHCPIFPSVAVLDTCAMKFPVTFREELRNLRDDYVFWLDILRQDLLAEGYSDILVDYRMRDNSLTSNKFKMIGPQWKVYRNVLKLGPAKSFYFLCSWGLNGIKKYWKKNQ